MPPSFDWGSVGGREVKPQAEAQSHFDWNAVGGKPISEPTHHEGSSWKRHAGRAGRAAATGIAGLADIPNLAALGLHAAGLKKDPHFYESIAGKTQNKIDELTEGKLKPRTKAEEYQDAIAEGLAPLVLTGGAGLAGNVARHGAKALSKKALTGAGSATASSAGSSAALKAYIDENKDDPRMSSALIASLIGGKVGKTGYRLAKNPKNALAEASAIGTRFDPHKYEELSKLGVPLSMADVSKSKVPRYGELIFAKTPGSMGPLGKFHNKKLEELSQKVGVSPKEISDLERMPAHHLAKKGAAAFGKKKSDQFEELSQKFKPREDQARINRETVDVSDLIKQLEEKGKGLTTEAERHAFHQTIPGKAKLELERFAEHPGLSSADIHALKKQGYSDEIIKRMQGSSEVKVPYAAFDLARRDALKLKESLPRGTQERREASEIYSALSSKRHEFVEKIGTPIHRAASKEARGMWEEYASAAKSNLKKYVTEITGMDDDTKAFAKLKSQPKAFQVAREGLDAADQKVLASTFMADLGRDRHGFNINTAHTSFMKLAPSVKKEFLKTMDPSQKKEFISTMKFIGKNKKDIEKLANTSGTAHTSKLMELVDKYKVGAGALLGHANPTILGSLLVGHAGLNLGARTWTNQDFLKRMHTVTAAKKPQRNLWGARSVGRAAVRTGQQSRNLEDKKSPR